MNQDREHEAPAPPPTEVFREVPDIGGEDHGLCVTRLAADFVQVHGFGDDTVLDVAQARVLHAYLGRALP